MKCFNWLYAYQTKARNPGNTIAATNPVFGLLMTSSELKPLMTFNDLQNETVLTKALCISKES